MMRQIPHHLVRLHRRCIQRTPEPFIQIPHNRHPGHPRITMMHLICERRRIKSVLLQRRPPRIKVQRHRVHKGPVTIKNISLKRALRYRQHTSPPARSPALRKRRNLPALTAHPPATLNKSTSPLCHSGSAPSPPSAAARKSHSPPCTAPSQSSTASRQSSRNSPRPTT